MSEQDIREGMRVAVWDEPPLDFDPDQLIAKAEKVRSRRRALVSVGVGTALVVVSAFALPTFLIRSNSDNPGVNVAKAPTSSAEPTDPDTRRSRRLSQRVADRLPHVLPSARGISVVPERPSIFDKPNAPTTKQNAPTTQPKANGKVTAYIGFEDGIGPTAIQLVVADSTGRAPDVCAGGQLCQQEDQPDGTKVVISEVREGSELTTVAVTHIRKDGMTVTLYSFSHNPTNGSGLRQTVPIGPDGLRQLATDPLITWD
ncbi:hypothetical protein Lesp02_54760 [Lentzea sp. NBRC 105346]|uniref:hypothetical protein n=1 Tax=Lentzea sp. NBRC 105346 TaxID=3032205 RepID=UPI0024A17798|nr:hypothetical protein [Lentzea sp. NBRC 105346]GLZ33288.1 hypothetical protein Lesp02_54760 [Lentzea sp. NBRC 105346]